MSLNQQENLQTPLSQQTRTKTATPVQVLKIAGLVALVVAFTGPWIYGPIGKSGDWGWQPVWGMLLSFWTLNLLIIFSAVTCFCYVELYYRLGRPPLSALLKWIGGFVALSVVLPLVAWTIVDMSGRSKVQQNTDGSLGWAVWVGLLGLILLVVGLRLQIREIRKTQTEITGQL